MFIHVVDSEGLFVEDAFVDELTAFTIEAPVPDGFYKPKWDGSQWIEGLTQSEIDNIKNVNSEPTEAERITVLEDALLSALLGGTTND